MFGPPKDVPDQCNAHLYMGDDYGDNKTTMRCSLPEGHDGLHQEKFMRGPDDDKPVTITWEYDEKPVPLKDPVECEDCYERVEREDAHKLNKKELKEDYYLCADCYRTYQESGGKS